MLSPIKKLSFAISLVFLAAFISPTQEAPSWKPDKPHSFVNFSIGHLFSVVTGRFTEFEGDFNFDPNNVEGSKASFTVYVNSIETDTKARNEHLKTADFFDAKKYPTITFVSTKITRRSATKFKVYGKLTIKDVTKDVVLPLKITGQMESPLAKNTMVLGVDIKTTIKRSDYGVGVNQWAMTTIVGDDVDIHIPMELIRPIK